MMRGLKKYKKTFINLVCFLSKIICIWKNSKFAVQISFFIVIPSYLLSSILKDIKFDDYVLNKTEMQNGDFLRFLYTY